MPSNQNIINSIASAELHVTELVDPDQIKFYSHSLANQVNTFRMKWSPQKHAADLSDCIADILIETTAQGASLLEVHVIDPAWTLLLRDAKGVSYIDVDDQGFIWPPIEVTFPKDNSDATWRLCQVRASTSLTEANLILTFEDKIVSELREHFGQQISFPNQTRAEFLQSLVKQANDSPAFPGEVDIRFVPLLPKETFSLADLSMQQRIPASATQSHPPPARKKPNKNPGKVTGTGLTGNPFTHPFAPIVPPETPAQQAVQGIEIRIQAGVDALIAPFRGDPFVPAPPKPPSFLGH